MTVIIFTIYLSYSLNPQTSLPKNISFLLIEGFLDFDYLEQRQGANNLLAVMARGTMLCWYRIFIIYHGCRLQDESAKTLSSLVARIGIASDVKVFSATHVEAILASKLK